MSFASFTPSLETNVIQNSQVNWGKSLCKSNIRNILIFINIIIKFVWFLLLLISVSRHWELYILLMPIWLLLGILSSFKKSVKILWISCCFVLSLSLSHLANTFVKVKELYRSSIYDCFSKMKKLSEILSPQRGSTIYEKYYETNLSTARVDGLQISENSFHFPTHSNQLF